MNKTIYLINKAVIATTLLFSAVHLVSANEQQASQESEVISVVGEKPLAYYRIQMEKAEMDFYEAYNALADNKKYKVICRKETRLGSRIKDRVCYPQFVLDRMAQETQDALSSGNNFPSLKQIEHAVSDEREESLRYVEKVVQENPSLLVKLLKMAEKRSAFEVQKANL